MWEVLKELCIDGSGANIGKQNYIFKTTDAMNVTF
jgi:hypothetical protein